MKKTALIGASGFVGSAILNELLNRGYEVEALVRNPENIKIKNPHLTIKQVDVSDTDTLTKMLKGYDTVISAYNPGWSNPDIYTHTAELPPHSGSSQGSRRKTVADCRWCRHIVLRPGIKSR